MYEEFWDWIAYIEESHDLQHAHSRNMRWFTRKRKLYTRPLLFKKAFWSFLTALRCDALSRIWNAFGIQGDFLLCLFKNKTGQERCYCQRKGEMDTFLRICVKYKVVNLLIHTMKSFFPEISTRYFCWKLTYLLCANR